MNLKTTLAVTILAVVAETNAAIPAMAVSHSNSVHNTLIEPGRAVGALRIGLPIPHWYFLQIGRPNIINSAGGSWGGVLNTGVSGFMSVDYDAGTAKVGKIVISDVEQDLRKWPDFRTKEGVGLGTKVAVVKARFPSGIVSPFGMDVDSLWEVPDKGILFGIYRDRVSIIEVERPR